MNEVKKIEPREDRCPGMTYTDMLEGDSRTPPDYLFEETNIDMPNDPLPIEPYVSEEFAALEREIKRQHEPLQSGTRSGATAFQRQSPPPPR